MFIIPRKISNSIKFLEFFAESFPNCVTSLSDELIRFEASDSSSGFVDWYSFVADVEESSSTSNIRRCSLISRLFLIVGCSLLLRWLNNFISNKSFKTDSNHY